jgi:steroid 5-alpha reductase family enzyme
MLLKLLALAWAISAAAMAALWFWQRRGLASGTVAALWPALVGALAVLYANMGNGAWMRRSAIGWMMGSWGARLAIQGMYTRAALPVEAAPGRPLWLFQLLAVAAAAASAPALLASLNRAPDLSIVELAACALWVIGFTGETTADRQMVRFSSKLEHKGLQCRTGLWRYSRSVDRIFEGMIWCAYAAFGLAAL